mgnify:FL=1
MTKPQPDTSDCARIGPKIWRSKLWILLSGLGLLLLSLSVAISLGSVAIPIPTVWGVLLHKIAPALLEPSWSPGREAIIWDIRFPRAVLACLVGAGLAICGTAVIALT